MKRFRLIITTILFAASITAGWLLLVGNAQASNKDAYVDKGKRLFSQYCASCHGVDGKGQGPVAGSLKTAPADLTAIQKKGEKFPFTHIAVLIDGEKTDRSIEAHGTGKMPVWGTVFRQSRGLQKESYIYALTKYIESIQAAR
ncbi:MAG: cytochrome c [Acidobacteriota bacterium]